MTEVLTDSLDLVADLGELRGLGPWLSVTLGAAGLGSLQGSWELALHEVCVNVVTHAYAHSPGRIRIRSRVDRDVVEFEIRDEGAAAFDPAETVEPVPGEPQIHGYGLMIVRQLVDEVRYTREEGTNVWLLRTRR